MESKSEITAFCDWNSLFFSKYVHSCRLNQLNNSEQSQSLQEYTQVSRIETILRDLHKFSFYWLAFLFAVVWKTMMKIIPTFSKHLTISCLIIHLVILLKRKGKEKRENKNEKSEFHFFLTSEYCSWWCWKKHFIRSLLWLTLYCWRSPLQIFQNPSNLFTQHNMYTLEKGVGCWFAAGKILFCGMMKAIVVWNNAMLRVSRAKSTKQKKQLNEKRCLMFRLSLSTLNEQYFSARKHFRV